MTNSQTTDDQTETRSPGCTSGAAPGFAAWLLFLPLVAWLLLLVVAPTFMLIVYSFCDRDDDGLPVFQFTWANYQEIFSPALLPALQRTLETAVTAAIVAVAITAAIRRRFSAAALRWGLLVGGCGYLSYALHFARGIGGELKIFWQSTEVAGMASLLCLLVGYPVAYFIGRSAPGRRNRLLMLVMIPFWTSFVIRTYAWFSILNQNGLLNTFLKNVHLQMLIPESGEVLYTPAAVVIGLVYAYLPFMILPIYGSVERLDDSLVEAALDLGAGPVRTLANVVFPLTSPGVVAGLLLVFVPGIAMFAVTDLMGGNKFILLGNEIENQFGSAGNQPLGAALGVTLMLMFALVFLATGFRRPGGVA